MRRFVAAVVLCASVAAQDAATGIRGMLHPALSPDGKRVAFSWHGDIWACPVEGGRAERVTEDAADEQKPAWSPDGKSIAFSSDASKTRDIFIVDLATRAVRQLTHHTSDDDAPAWSPDGKWIAFQSSRDSNLDLALNDSVFDVWRVPTEGGTAARVTRFRGENPAYSPDGKWIAYDRYSTGYADGEHNVFVIASDGSGQPREVASGGEDTRRPAWKGETIYFSHEANGIVFSAARNVWRVAAAGGALIQVTGFRTDHCTWPATCEKSDALVFEHGFELYSINVRDARAAPRKLTITVESPYRDDADAKRTFKEGAKSPAWSPDGARFAAVVDGDVMVMNADGSGARALTRTTEEERDPAWTSDGKSIVYVRGAWGGAGHVYRIARDGGEPERLTKEPGLYRTPRLYGERLVVAREVDGERGLVVDGKPVDGRGVEEMSPAWGPDGTLAYVRSTSDGSAIVVGEKAFPPDSEMKYGLAWSPDGKSIAYGVRGESAWNVAVLDVASGKATALPAESGTSRQSPSWAPDSSMIAHEEVRTMRMRSAEPGERVVVRDAKDPKTRVEVNFSLEKPYSRREEMLAVLTQVWNAYNTAYYDPFFHGIDWTAMRDKYAPLAAEARTMPELWDLINDMIRELRSSHVHLSPPSPRVGALTGMLGADLDAGRKVLRVEPDGPAAKAGIKEGDAIVCEGDLDRLLVADKEIELTVGERKVKVTPINRSALRALKYRNTIAWRKEKVKELSGGRLAYHHVRMMVQPEVQALKSAMEKDWPTAEGLVLDIRDGVGGMAHKPIVHLLDSGAPERINAKPASWMRNRNGWTGPDKYGGGGAGGRIAGKSWDKPVIMIQNEISRSDKEILPHTFRHAQVGYIVGMPTAGGVIGGNDLPVRGGARITVSIQGWFTADGRNLEGYGVPPDFRVPLTHEDLYAGRDPQLEKAVEVLLAQMDGKIKPPRGERAK